MSDLNKFELEYEKFAYRKKLTETESKLRDATIKRYLNKLEMLCKHTNDNDLPFEDALYFEDNTITGVEINLKTFFPNDFDNESKFDELKYIYSRIKKTKKLRKVK